MSQRKQPSPKKRPIPAQESLTEMVFPLQGIDVSTEFELQPDQTTPVGLNVRGYEPMTMRARGGSRNGLSRYINAQVSGARVIQHLNYIVVDDGNALWTANDPAADLIDDPSTNNLSARNPGRQVRRGGSGVSPNRKYFTAAKLTPTITPKNITKAQGQLFTFAGTEFTATGLLPGDQITSVTLTSAGTPQSAAPGNYQIGAAFAVYNTSFGLHLQQGKYNPIVFKTGIMTVTSLAPVAFGILMEGGKSGLTQQNYSISNLASNPPIGLGEKNWRVVQYLKADTFPPITSVESGTMTASGLPNGLVSPILIYRSVFQVPSISWSSNTRLEYSPDGTTWPPPPVL